MTVAVINISDDKQVSIKRNGIEYYELIQALFDTIGALQEKIKKQEWDEVDKMFKINLN